jgi:hypothetical protein
MTRAILTSVALLAPSLAFADEPKSAEAKIKEIAGVAEFLRGVPKHFATLRSIDSARRSVTLLIEGEKLAKSWELAPDAEVKVLGWWGRLEQFKPGDRVWAWFSTDRHKQPVNILMLADEMSEQDIHDARWALVDLTDSHATFGLGKTDRKLERTNATVLDGATKGKRAYLQSAGEKMDRVRLILGADAFEKRRAEQRAWLAKRWEDEGLPGAVTFMHALSGEIEVMIDHEAMRWARALKTGDSVTLAATPPIKGVVREMRAWRERTQLRLVVAAIDQGDLRLGQRVNLKMTPPSAAVQEALLPPDIGRRTDRHERIEWFLASVYCTCGVSGNVCTGHFYTLASCNPNGCGHPNFMRKTIGKLIDDGKTDEQIFEILLKDQGPTLLRPHLMP